MTLAQTAVVVQAVADQRISFAVGGSALLILLGLLGALIAFGGGREHS
ncbi:MAG: hypothetical protein QOD98_2341 [Nocardioidaceae bacterium]|jgi:hypothetical protein|nr:hypothetical protein [Nocardioidaceae bacterium]